MLSRISSRALVRRTLVSTIRPLGATRTAVTDNNAPTGSREAWLWIDSVFPVRLGRWDLRYYVGLSLEEELLGQLSTILSAVRAHDFRLLSIEPQHKEGGVFVRFAYSPSGSRDGEEVDLAVKEIEQAVREEAGKRGGPPNWIGIRKGGVWRVRGTPWREDMYHFASPNLKFAFEGPDIQEEDLYSILRPYGLIEHLTPPSPAPAGTRRAAIVTYRQLRSAVTARNVVHGLRWNSDSSTQTRLHAQYERPLEPHMLRTWLAAHPRIVLPMLVFLLGTLTYTIFDPIRAIMIQARMEEWFDYRKFGAWKWLRVNALDKLDEPRHWHEDARQNDLAVTHTTSGSSSKARNVKEGAEKVEERTIDAKKKLGSPQDDSAEEVWKERAEAFSALKNYLSDMPMTVAFIHGPQGSGKSKMISTILRDTDRKALVVDCAELHKATSDTQLVGALARQTGYRPMFTFLNSMNNIVDLASVGLIGQKAGMSTSLKDQLQQILGVTETALKRVSSSHRTTIDRQVQAKKTAEAEARRRQRMSRGTFHDARQDYVAGNGVMSELGVGDEWFGENDWDVNGGSGVHDVKETEARQERERNQEERHAEDMEAVSSLPIVVIKNFGERGGLVGREEVLGALAEWAAKLAQDQIAHVVVVSDNRENVKRLSKALPSKPLNNIALYDADATSALSFVTKKLRDTGVDLELSSQQVTYVQRLGGRASDLESLIHKVRGGQQIEEAVEDIINRGVSELRKNAFGDDPEDAKSLPWAREQAWAILRQLASQAELPYHDVLFDFPFKGDEVPLKAMEQAELISIGTQNGRPSTIRPGKPVFKYVFERLVRDPIFQASQDLVYNEKQIASAESTIATCEKELSLLAEIGGEERRLGWFGGRGITGGRAAHLLEKMRVAEGKVQLLEKKNLELKRVLKKGG
ncbi:hypothetical protein PLICRDRAFT_590111 [Plicaturopsis crispa FD-325 SS-3]|nr:hypothetical protein PLICRDRAFT_590111 [Plicaturopsis crispa FD-325 SS-3]